MSDPWYWRSPPEGRTGAVVFAGVFHRNSKRAGYPAGKALRQPTSLTGSDIPSVQALLYSEWMSANVDTTVRERYYSKVAPTGGAEQELGSPGIRPGEDCSI